jgi:hypothetical protein
MVHQVFTLMLCLLVFFGIPAVSDPAATPVGL